MISRTIIVAVLLCLLLSIQAQDKLSIANGLSNNNVKSIIQDRQGLIWIGTEEGLNRYNGYEITVFRHSPLDDNSVGASSILKLFEDSNGHLWIGTRGGGLSKFIRSKQSFETFHSGNSNLTSNDVFEIFEDSRGILWIGTDGGGICSLDPATGEFKCLTKESSALSDNRVLSINEDRDGTLWIGTWGGINKMILGNQIERVDELDGSIWEIVNLSDQKLAIGTIQKGALRLNSKNGEFEPMFGAEEELNRASISIIQEHKDDYWIGTLSSGLYKKPIKGGNLEKVDLNESSGSIQDVYIDRAGSAWIATWGDGVFKIDPNHKPFNSWHSVDDTRSLRASSTTSIHEDEQGNIWIGTKDGLYQYDANRELINSFFDHSTSTSIRNNAIQVIERIDGHLWVGTTTGLDVFDLDKLQVVKRVNNLIHSEVHAISSFRNKVWVGTRNGLTAIDKENMLTHYLQGENILSMQALDNELLVGTWNGLFIIDGEGGIEVLNAGKKEGMLSNNHVNHIHISLNGDIWVGTDSGTERFDLKSRTFGRIPGFDLSVHAIESDKEGLLWASTNSGLYRIDPKNGIQTAFDAGDGVQSDQFSRGASFQSMDGELFFGGIGGVTSFYPGQISQNPIAPQVILSDFQLLYESVDWFGEDALMDAHISVSDTVTLRHDDKVLNIEFAALNYINPQKNRYRFRLSHFDKDWVQAGKKRNASYTNLNPGTYVFWVQGSNNDGVWNEEGVKLTIVVEPAFWQTLWFWMVVAGLVVLTAFLGYKWRVGQLKAQREKLKQLVDQRTRELSFQQEELLKNELALNQAKLENERLDRERLQSELDKRQGQLNSYTLRIIQKNEMLELLKEKIVALDSTSSSNISGEVKGLIKLVDQNLNLKKDWDQFQKIFAEVHSNFFESLKRNYPQLTANDLRLCSLIRLNLSTKEIATISGVSPHSVKIARYRVRKKMDLPAGQKLSEFILSR